MSARVVQGTVKGRSAAKVDGGTFPYVELAADAALKGPPAKAGERVLVFDGAQWFQHTHAAAIKGGVVSYAEAHYATPLPAAEIKPGAAVIVFLRGEAPPPGFPAGAAFLSCGGCFERAERAADVARMKTAAFGDPITLKMGEVAVLPDGLELEVKGHTHKRPITGGPQKEMAEVQATTRNAQRAGRPRSHDRARHAAQGHVAAARVARVPAGPDRHETGRRNDVARAAQESVATPPAPSRRRPPGRLLEANEKR